MESKMRIAVCDDEQAIADLVGQLLVEAGFAPTVFYAAPDLLACQADDPFDLVILGQARRRLGLHLKLAYKILVKGKFLF